MGSRLQADRPKGLLEIGGGPLLGRSLALLHDAGVTEIVLVAGWRQEVYREYLAAHFPAVRVLVNPAFATTGSLASLLIGVRATSGGVVVVESDLLYEKRAPARLLAAPGRDTLLASGFTASGDEVWVHARSGRLAHLSKQPWTGAPRCGELVGLTRLSRPALDRLLAVAPTLPAEAHYEDGLNAICAAHPVEVCLVDDLQWCEIDTPEHLRRAREQVWPRIQVLDRNQG
jgi:2-aminoethylphosphonate-pyruvate transaminase